MLSKLHLALFILISTTLQICVGQSPWSTMDGGCIGGDVKALTMFNNQLYIGGYFSNLGTNSLSGQGIGLFNGQNMTSIGSSNGNIFALTSTASYVYACGIFSSIGPTSASNIARYNGSTWEALGSGTSKKIRKRQHVLTFFFC